MVLLVNQHTVPIFTDIANAFAEDGHETVLFTGHIEEGGKPLSQKIKVLRSIPYNRKSSISRLLTWMIFSFHYFFFLLWCRKPSRIIVVTNPPIAPLVTSMVSRWRRIPFYVVLYDLYPEALVQASLLKANAFLYKVWQRQNGKMFRNAEKIFTLSESMKAASMVYSKDDPEKISVIHNWADTTYIKPVPKSENAFVKWYGLENKTVILYAGNMGLTHDLESLIGAAEILQSVEDLIFLFIGDGGKRRALEELKKVKSLRNILFLPYQDEKNFPLAMAAADIGVVTLGRGAEGISVPSKTYINFAAGVCLLAIAPGSSELSRLVLGHQAGLVCEPGDSSKVAAAIKLLLESPIKVNTYKQNALKASALYTPENSKQYIRKVMEGMTNPNYPLL